MYKHFTLDDRIMLSTLRNYSKESFKQISDKLGKDKSATVREFNRNKRKDGIYEPHYAHRQSQKKRKLSKIGSRKIENDIELEQHIEDMLDPLTSPEVVTQEPDITVCHETIYAWISRSRPDLKEKLPYRGKKRRKYGTKRSKKQGWTADVRSIDERPEGIEQRKDLFHYEGDTMKGSKGRLLTYTDRESRFEIAVVIPRGLCDLVQKETKKIFSKYPVNTITYDRGSEFSLWRMIEKDTESIVYFAHSYRSWERGTNENSNGRLRRVFPKKFDFSTITQKDVNAVTWKMNHTKRKCLNWRTPCEVFGHCCTSS